MFLIFIRVEKSRTVIPAMFEASMMASKASCSINTNYFYDMLFTTVNLKLVHIVCHDKGQHDSAKCNPKLYLIAKQVKLLDNLLILICCVFLTCCVFLKIHSIDPLLLTIVNKLK